MGGHFAAPRDDALDAFGAKDGVDEGGEPRGGGEVLGLEFLRVREMVAEFLDVARQAIGFAARSESERGEAGAVADEDVGLVLDLEAVEERAVGAAALAFRAECDGLFQAARRDLVLPGVARVKLTPRPT